MDSMHLFRTGNYPYKISVSFKVMFRSNFFSTFPVGPKFFQFKQGMNVEFFLISTVRILLLRNKQRQIEKEFGKIA